MNRIGNLNRRYAASAELARNGAEVVIVGDPLGASLNTVARRLLKIIREDGPEPWENLVGAVNSLRWCMIKQPQPLKANDALTNSTAQVKRQVQLLRDSVADNKILDELMDAIEPISQTDSPIGHLLLQSVEEVGPQECIVVVANKSIQFSFTEWLGKQGPRIMTMSELRKTQPAVEQIYAVGPPQFYPSSLVTAPVTSNIGFFMPAWYGDRSIPSSPISLYADGAIKIAARLFPEGDSSAREMKVASPGCEEEFLPQPSWSASGSPSREPLADEVVARKVLLSGNLATWLDDGDRIRALDPEQPSGERVVYTEVSDVRVGTYLLLRQGTSERGALDRVALGLLQNHGVTVEESQKAWKEKLARQLQKFSYQQSVNELRERGVKTADRVQAWTDPSLVRPNRDEDFERLLTWLSIPIQPTFDNATMLRRARHQASSDMRDKLETAVSEADLSELERDGHWFLKSQNEGIRGLVATRVIAISPHQEILSRQEARVLFEDRSGQWLE